MVKELEIQGRCSFKALKTYKTNKGVCMEPFNTLKRDKRLEPFYSQYQIPSGEWLEEKFKSLKLGWLKASEMEIYLAYMLMYQQNHLHRSAFDIADFYGYTESKVAKLQIEFARRFKKIEGEGDAEFLTRIFRSMFPKGADEKPSISIAVDGDKVCFSVRNAADARRIKRIAAERGLVVGSVVNNTEFSLKAEVFASLFMECDAKFKSRMKACIKRSDRSWEELFPTLGQTITRKGVRILKDVCTNTIIDFVCSKM